MISIDHVFVIVSQQFVYTFVYRGSSVKYVDGNKLLIFQLPDIFVQCKLHLFKMCSPFKLFDIRVSFSILNIDELVNRCVPLILVLRQYIILYGHIAARKREHIILLGIYCSKYNVAINYRCLP